MEMRICEDCGIEANVTNFANAGKVNGIQYYRYKCIQCYSKFKQVRKNSLRNKFVEFKKTLKCEDCGTNDHRVLEFHHKDPSQKDREVSIMITWGWKKLMDEVAKCSVLCANCHRVLHYEEREQKRRGLAQPD